MRTHRSLNTRVSQSKNVPFGGNIAIEQNSKRNASYINPLNAELNPIYHLLALLGAHHILHISRIRVNVSYRGQFQLKSLPVFSDMVVIFFNSIVVFIPNGQLLDCTTFVFR
jgi:hypothetical protein